MQVLSTHFSLWQGFLMYWFNLPEYELNKILFRTVESEEDSENGSIFSLKLHNDVTLKGNLFDF